MCRREAKRPVFSGHLNKVDENIFCFEKSRGDQLLIEQCKEFCFQFSTASLVKRYLDENDFLQSCGRAGGWCVKDCGRGVALANDVIFLRRYAEGFLHAGVDHAADNWRKFSCLLVGKINADNGQGLSFH